MLRNDGAKKMIVEELLFCPKCGKQQVTKLKGTPIHNCGFCKFEYVVFPIE